MAPVMAMELRTVPRPGGSRRSAVSHPGSPYSRTFLSGQSDSDPGSCCDWAHGASWSGILAAAGFTMQLRRSTEALAEHEISCTVALYAGSGKT